MTIQEVASKTGLTKKSIRYYEEEGLLTPIRKSNTYREFSDDDLKTLKLIKFLRELNVPVNDIKKLKSEEITLEDCMKDRINKINSIEKSYEKIKNMCIEIIDNKDTYKNIDVTKYFNEVNILNKKGFSMKDISKRNKRKIEGAVLSSLMFSSIFIFLICVLTYGTFFVEDSIPIILYLFVMFILGMPILGIVINLAKRIKEIKGGEEDEASKY
ncbi:MAG: MerR family transcriptional regulator [Ruminococcus sp.]|nr:MerR family transcriptional regulator [Ruminococcus sp.]